MKSSHIRNAIFAISILVFVAACGGCGSGAAPQPPPSGGGPGIPPSPIDPGVLGDGRMTELVETIRDRHDLPALAAVIVNGGQIADQGASGVRSITSGAAVTTTDRWHIGSVTKAMTATLAAILVEQSVISWDTTPLDIWPEFAASMHPQYASVTVVDLLSHQAGLRVAVDTIPSISEVVNPARGGGVVSKRRLWAKELLELTPVNATGGFLYTNAGYIIVGSMLETVTGSDWETLMTDLLLGPLGMTSTGFGAPGTSGQFDQPYGHLDETGSLVAIPPGPDADNPPALGPAGTIHTTLSDYAQYMFAHLEGERGIPGLVSAETFQFLHTPVRNSSYALGWGTDNNQPGTEGPVFSHSGSNGRWWANAGLAPGLNVGVLTVTNAANDAAQDGSEELGQLLVQRIQNSQ